MGLAQFPVDRKADDGADGDNRAEDCELLQLRGKDGVHNIGRHKELEPEQEIVAEAVTKHLALIERIVSPETPVFHFQQGNQRNADAPEDDGDTDNPDDQTDVLEKLQTIR